jgi:lysophospholipase L1-like esterase
MRSVFRQWGALIALTAALAVAPGAQANQKQKLNKNCQAPQWVADTQLPLPSVRRALRREKQIKIVTIGSSSTMGSGGSGPDASWPAQLAQALTKRLPEAKVMVVNKAEMRQSVPQMLARFDKDVLAEKPSLVIWEAGTNEAARQADIDTLIADLQVGIDRLLNSKIDVIMMDMQYARDTARIINFQPYVEAIGRLSTMRDIFVFPRYDTMRNWVENEQITFGGQTKEEAVKTADTVYACLGSLVADLLANNLK